MRQSGEDARSRGEEGAGFNSAEQRGKRGEEESEFRVEWMEKRVRGYLWEKERFI